MLKLISEILVALRTKLALNSSAQEKDQEWRRPVKNSNESKVNASDGERERRPGGASHIEESQMVTIATLHSLQGCIDVPSGGQLLDRRCREPAPQQRWCPLPKYPAGLHISYNRDTTEARRRWPTWGAVVLQETIKQTCAHTWTGTFSVSLGFSPFCWLSWWMFIGKNCKQWTHRRVYHWAWAIEPC